MFYICHNATLRSTNNFYKVVSTAIKMSLSVKLLPSTVFHLKSSTEHGMKMGNKTNPNKEANKKSK